MALGDAGFETEQPTPIVRFYWHLASDSAPHLVHALTSRLNRRGYRFGSRSSTTRRATRPAVDASHALRPPPRLRRRRTDLSARPIADSPPGCARDARVRQAACARLAVAEDPGDGDSFGMHRVRLLAEGIVAAHQRGHDGPSPMPRASRRSASRLTGFDLDAPYINSDRPPLRAMSDYLEPPRGSRTDLRAGVLHDGRCNWWRAAHEARTADDHQLRGAGTDSLRERAASPCSSRSSAPHGDPRARTTLGAAPRAHARRDPTSRRPGSTPADRDRARERARGLLLARSGARARPARRPRARCGVRPHTATPRDRGLLALPAARRDDLRERAHDFAASARHAQVARRRLLQSPPSATAQPHRLSHAPPAALRCSSSSAPSRPIATCAAALTTSVPYTKQPNCPDLRTAATRPRFTFGPRAPSRSHARQQLLAHASA